ncbi:MAG: hypothetical protein ACFCVH_22105 [Alphaproteobacteria bacterium]
MQNLPLAFPIIVPGDLPELEGEPVYDPAIHLALEPPAHKLALADLGYSGEEIAQCPSTIAISGPFRLLSDEGVRVVLDICRRLSPYARGAERIERFVRQSVYRSRFLRAFCSCPQVTAFMADILECPLSPHTMPSQWGHINYAPETLGRPIDRWHHDTLQIDYVLMVTDPRTFRGGRFQYFMGTKAEAAELAQGKADYPPEKVIVPELPAAGWGVVMQGNMVVHRGGALEAPAERITLVNGYVPLEIGLPDFSRLDDLRVVDPPNIILPEWVRHKAWRARGGLDKLLADLPFTGDRTTLIGLLRGAMGDIEAAIRDLEDESEAREHFYTG